MERRVKGAEYSVFSGSSRGFRLEFVFPLFEEEEGEGGVCAAASVVVAAARSFSSGAWWLAAWPFNRLDSRAGGRGAVGLRVYGLRGFLGLSREEDETAAPIVAEVKVAAALTRPKLAIFALFSAMRSALWASYSFLSPNISLITSEMV